MKRLLTLVLLLWALPALAIEVAGVNVADKAKVGAGELVLNGAAKGKPIPGEDFYRALLRIWLGDKPVDGDLKKSMLGQAL